MAGMIVFTLTMFIGFSIVVAAWTSVPEVARAPGELMPSDDFLQIEAGDSGTVVDVHVREGDDVSSGQVLATLFSSELSRQTTALEEELATLSLRKTNQEFILNALEQETLSLELGSRSDRDVEFALSTLSALIAQQESERDVLRRLASKTQTQKRELGRLGQRRVEKIEQVREIEELFDKGLSTKAAVSVRTDALSDVDDQIHALEISLSSDLQDIEVLKAKIVQDRLELERQYVEENFDTTQQIKLKETELSTLRDRQASLQIVAPMAGRIHSVGFPNEGEVIDRGETLFELLPAGDSLIAVIRIPTRDIGHIFLGMDVKLRLETFDARSTLPVEAVIASISPNRVYDRDLGEDYFRATARLKQRTQAYAALEDRLTAGMVVTAEVVTRERSMLTYLLRPIERSFSLAFNER
ncbi:MAG: HlyD family efflux transporter periplasmic adaptor subunit [Pseudomonadota bacterium]